MSVFFPHDFASRAAGASDGCLELHQRFSQETDILIPRHYGIEARYYLSEAVRLGLQGKQRPHFFLGDHSATFTIVLEVLRRYGAINFVYFDAHHDAYNDPIISHWSFVHHLDRIENLNIHCIGGDWEPNRADCNYSAPDENLPTYISIDADYFPELKSVGHFVDNPTGSRCIANFRDTMKQLENMNIVATDFCEWYGQNEEDAKIIERKILPEIMK